jgi:hypothetical protein
VSPVVVSVRDDRALQAAVLAFKVADRGLKKRVNDATRSTFNAPWKAGIAQRASTRLEQRVLVPGARVAAGNPPTFVAAASKRRLRGGLVPDDDGFAVEFGAADKLTTYQRRKPSGGTTSVTRHTRRQLPRRRKAGPIMQTAGEMGHRAASLWVQLIVKTYYEAADEGR